MTIDVFVYSILLFVVLFIVGVLLCLILYKWQFTLFFRSKLWKKVYYWIPIFFIFLTILCSGLWVAILAVCFIIGLAIRELLNQPKKNLSAGLYVLTISFTLAHLILFFIPSSTQQSINVLLVIGYCSVLSDVCAYFFGNFLGRHKLPTFINNQKSWEGVGGQLVGAIVGFYLISPVIHPHLPISFAILIGIASATGDILNSVVKRRIQIKDWGATIPGHGGVLDRFASIALSIAITYWWLEIINL